MMDGSVREARPQETTHAQIFFPRQVIVHYKSKLLHSHLPPLFLSITPFDEPGYDDVGVCATSLKVISDELNFGGGYPNSE